MRLNVYLQRAGVGSRREAERLVAEGRVRINGKPAVPTQPVAETDKVEVDGRIVAPDSKPVPRLFMLNKPLNVLVTTYDAEGRAIVYDLPALNKKGLPRLMNVGRLDVNSEGLLLFSSDGPLAQAMMSPKNALERVYRIRVRGRLSPRDIEQIAKGVTVNGIAYRGAKIVEERKPTGANTWYQITLTEGKNREVRKLMEHFGCIVNRLIRIQYGPFHLNDLATGLLKEIPEKQVAKLTEHLRAKGAAL